MRRHQLAVAFLVWMVIAVVAYGINAPQGASVKGAHISPSVVTTGLVDAGLVRATIVDAGTVNASVFSSYAAADAVSILVPNKSKICMDLACTMYLRGDDVFGAGVTTPSGINFSFNRNVLVTGNVAADGTISPGGGLVNSGTAAPCTSYGSTVCVHDLAGLAVSNGGNGGVVATVSDAGMFTSLMAAGGRAFVSIPGASTCYNGPSACTSYVWHNNSSSILEIGGQSGIELDSNTTATGTFKIGTSGTAISAIVHDSESVDFDDTPIGTCTEKNTTHTGITTSSQAFWDFPSAWFNAPGSIFNAYITGSGTATIRHCCVDVAPATSCNPAAGTVEVRWFNN